MKSCIPLLTLVLLGGCQSPELLVANSASRRITEAEKLVVWPENRTAWRVSIEPLVATRTSGTNSLGPREDLQPGPTKSAAKGFGTFIFKNLPDNPPHLPVDGDLYVLHLTAGTDRSLEDRELFITIPRRIVDKPGPRKTELIIDEKGATFVLGRVRRFEPWSPARP